MEDDEEGTTDEKLDDTRPDRGGRGTGAMRPSSKSGQQEAGGADLVED
jgi:hypothetical protein